MENAITPPYRPVGPSPPMRYRALVHANGSDSVYFSTLASAIRKADPNHLLLGCRFAGLDYAPEILSACGRHCDVVSVNVYPWADLDTGIVLDRRGGVLVADALRAFHERAGGAWSLSNGLVRLSGRVGGARMADEIAWGGRVVGRWGALLEWDGGGTTRWTEVSHVTDDLGRVKALVRAGVRINQQVWEFAPASTCGRWIRHAA